MAQPFPTLVVQEAWARAGGCCECESDAHGHEGRCGQRCIMPMQGGPNIGGWEADPVDPEGPLTLENCQITCAACHKANRTASAR